MKHLDGTDLLFVAAGMGGWTGTGAAPVIAGAAKELGILTVGIVTMPFSYEGKRRYQQATVGLTALENQVDSLIVISNNRLSSIANKLPIKQAFKPANDILNYAVRSIVDIIMTPGLINVDFADVKTILSCRGRAIMGTGAAEGNGRTLNALSDASNSPLLEGYNLDGAKGVLINVTGSASMTMDEFHEIIDHIHQKVADDANVISGLVVNEDAGDTLKVTVVASGLRVPRIELVIL